MNDCRSDSPVTLRIAPDLRRSALYVLCGGFLLLPVLAWARDVQDLAPLPWPGVVVYCTVLTLAVAVSLRWSVRIDDAGLARRWLFRWDLWPWSDFAGGLIEKRHRFLLIHRKRPWWRRRLKYEYFTPDDVERIVKAINTHYRPPELPEIPENLTIMFGLCRRATLSPRVSA